jgi:aspartate aminotransferase-like enzyme
MTTPTVPPLEPTFADLYARATKLMAQVLDTTNDLFLLPAEAIVALDAAVRPVTRPGG